jgi:hypothetical protein
VPTTLRGGYFDGLVLDNSATRIPGPAEFVPSLPIAKLGGLHWHLKGTQRVLLDMGEKRGQ